MILSAVSGEEVTLEDLRNRGAKLYFRPFFMGNWEEIPLTQESVESAIKKIVFLRLDYLETLIVE
jgi:hypothetical protein